MTLCIGILTDEGIVLSADSCVTISRAYEEDEHEYNAVKLHEINKRCGLLVSGQASFGDRKIRIGKLINRFMCNISGIENMDVEEVLHEMEKSIFRDIFEFKRKQITRFMLAGYTKQNTPCAYKISIGIGHNKYISKETLQLNSKRVSMDGIGIFDEIEKDTFNERLKELGGLIESGMINLKESIEYCKGVIDNVSDNMENKGVGPPVDIAVITRKRGFRWTTKHHKKKFKSIVSQPEK